MKIYRTSRETGFSRAVSLEHAARKVANSGGAMWFWSEDELAGGYSRAKAELAAGKRLRTSFFIYHRDQQREVS